MNCPAGEIVVADIAGSRALVVCNKPSVEAALLGLGFQVEGANAVRTIPDDDDRKALVNELIRLDALFSAGTGWRPAELLGLYREQGVVSGSYKVIFWRNPRDYAIETR